MSAIISDIKDDLQRLEELKRKIDEVKRELLSINGVTDKANFDRLNKELQNTTQQYRSLSSNVKSSVSEITASSLSLTKALGALGGIAALKGLVSQMISVRGEFQKADTAIQTMLGSKEKADALLSEVRQYAKISPLEFGDITRATQMMLGFNIESEKVPGFIKAIGDVSMGESGKFNSLTLAFSQMSAAGKLMGQDLNQMINAGFNPLSVMAEKTGKSIGQLKEEMSKGAITAEMVQQAFIDATSAGGKFYNMSENAAKTIEGQFSMMHDAIDSMFNELGKKSEGVIVGSIESVTKLIENYKKIGTVLLSLVGTYGAYRTAVALVTFAEEGHTVAMTLARTQILLTQKAQALLNATMLANPYVLATVALGGMVTALIASGDSMTAAEHAQKNFDDEMERNASLASKDKEEIDKLISVLRDETATQGERTDAYNTLISLYPALLSKYGSEKALVADLTGAYQLLNAEIAKKEKLQFQQSYDDARNRVKDLKRLKELRENRKRGGNTSSDDIEEERLSNKYSGYISQNGSNMLGFTSMDKAIATAEKEQEAYLEEARKRQIKDRTSNIKNFTKAQAEAEKKRWSDAISRAKKSGKTRVQDKGTESVSLEEAESYVGALDKHINTERKTMAQWRKSAQEETKKNRKAAKDLASSTELLTKEEAEKKMKAANDNISASEKAEKSFEVKADKSAASAAAKAKKERERLAKQQQQEAIKAGEAEEKAAEIRTKAKIEESRRLVDLEFSTREAEIKAMKDGSAKTLAQLELDKDKELDAIERNYEDIKQKRIDEAKRLWDADPSNKGKNFYESAAYKNAADDSNYTPEEMANKLERINAIWVNYQREVDDVNRQEAASMREYLKEYGDYQQQRLAITQEYDQKIKDAQTDGERLILGQQKDEALRQVDERFGLVTQAMADLFADASKKSVSAIQDIINKYEVLVEYMEGHKGSASKDELAKLGFSDSDIQKILKGEISIKELTDRLKELKGELKNRSPYQSFIGNIKDAIKLLNKATTKEDKANAFGQMAASVNDFLPALKEFGSDLANIFGQDDSKLSSAIDGLGGMMTAGEGVAQIMAGDIVGGAMSAVKGISQMVDAFDGMFGADYSGYEKMVEQYDRLIDVWNTLIDRKAEYIEMSYGSEAAKAGQEAIDIIERQTEAYKNLGKEWLNAGASAGSHSKGVRMRKGMDAEDWNNVAKALGRTVDNYAGLGGRLEGLFDLSTEELMRLQEQAPEFWSKLDEETRKYLDGIIEGTEKIEDMQKRVNEQLTSTSFDSLKDSFASVLYDMESTASKGGENIGDALFKSIVDNFILGEEFDSWLQGFYEKWAKKIGSGGMSKSDWDEYYNEYQTKLADKIAERDAWAAAMGYTGTSSDQTATSSAAEKITYDQAEIMTGILTAIQIAVEQGNIKKDTIQEYVSVATATTQDIRSINTEIRDIASDTRDIIARSYLELVEIRDNTGAIVRPIKDMQQDIADIKRDIQDKI